MDDNFCRIIAPDAVSYTQGGVSRSILAPFICADCFLRCHPEWGDGTRQIIVDYADGSRASVQEFWP